jgi:hypothetical protein
MLHRNKDNDVAQLTRAQLVQWAARIVRLSHAVDDEADQQAMVTISMEIKAAADTSSPVLAS